MNYNDLLDFLNYYKQKNKDINPGTVLGQLINNVVDKDTGAIPYFYLNENGKIKIAKNDGKNFQPTQEMQQGHAQILENLKGEDSETWMDRLVGALGGERQFSAIDDWNTNHLDALRDWNLNGRPANMESTTNDLKDGTQTNTEQTVNETAEQYNTEQEPINNEKPPQEEVKTESGPQMEVEQKETVVRKDSNGNEMYTFEDLRREAEERRRRAQEKNSDNTSSSDDTSSLEDTKSYDGDVNNPYYENDEDIWDPGAGSEEKLEEALNTKPPDKDEVLYENDDVIVMGNDPFDDMIDELDEDDILIEQQMGSRDNVQKEHSRPQQEEVEQANVDEEDVFGNIDFDSYDATNEEVNDITNNTEPEESQLSFEDEINQISKDLNEGNITQDEANDLVTKAYEKHKDTLDDQTKVVDQEKQKVNQYETDKAKEEVTKERPTFEDVVENALETREVNQEKPQYNNDSKPQYNQQHPVENLNKEKKPQTTEELTENAKKKRRKAQRKKGDAKPQYNQQEPYTKPPQVKPKEKPNKPQTNPKPNYEDSTIDLVNKNHDKNKKTEPKNVWQQMQETYGEIKQVLAKNRRAKSKKAYDLIRRGKYEEINVRTTMGRVQVVRNRRNGEIVQRTFISSGKDKIEYQMGHGKRGRIDYEVYRDADSGILNYLRHYRDKLGPIPRRETGNHIPTAVENPVTGEKTVTKKAEEAFAEAGEIVKNIKGDKWTEMDAETFNFDVEKERDKFRNPEDGEWVPEKYTKEEREFLENREQKFKDDLDLAEEEWQGFKENNKGLERKIKNKINKLENQLEDPKLSTAEKDKIRSKLADYKDRLDNFQSQKKALKDRRKKARQDWNNRNTEGKINQELKGITETVEGVDLDKFYEQYEKLKNIDINKLTGKEKYKYESQLKRAEILKKKLEETSLKEASLEKLKRNVLKSKRSIENMSPGQFVKEVGFSGVMSGITAVGTYKDNRREGRSVLSSAVRAGADFVLAETLGPGAYMALNLVKEAPDLAVKGASALFKETRRLNSSARFATFGEANFQDTQQLATMRQSGMELAKMSQYRLEQTLMGNEAKYLHR